MKFFKMVYFTKEGRGVEEGEREKRAFFRFWIRFWEKRYSIIGANFLYLLAGLVSIVISALLLYLAVSLFVNLDGTDNFFGRLFQGQDTDIFATETLFVLAFYFGILTSAIPIFAIGPLQAGFSFLLRSFAIEKPVFLWHDYISKARANFKLSVQVSLTNLLLGFFVLIDFAAYLAISNNSSGHFSNVPSFLLVIVFAFVLFLTIMLFMINFYLYPIMVTFNVNYKQLYKNAFILSLIRWLPNLLMILLNMVLVALPFLIPLKTPFVMPLVFYVFITPAFLGFMNNFYVSRTIKKYLIDNKQADKSAADKSAQENEEDVEL